MLAEDASRPLADRRAERGDLRAALRWPNDSRQFQPARATPRAGCSAAHQGHHVGPPSPASLLDCYPTGVYWRVTGTPVSTSPTPTGGLPPSAAANASRLCRLRHREIATTAPGSSSTVHVCAPKTAVGRGGALLGVGTE